MSQITILVVDDSQYMREILKLGLSEKGFEIITAGSGGNAQEILESNKKVHLVLLDITMVSEDGFTTLKKIREKKIWIFFYPDNEEKIEEK